MKEKLTIDKDLSHISVENLLEMIYYLNKKFGNEILNKLEKEKSERILNDYKKSSKNYPPKNYYKPWTKEEEIIVMESLNAKMSLENIADILGRSVNAIEIRIKRLSIFKNVRVTNEN
tara:strand:+ start:736 stop:1089 length:354 start_codon:yes stop_codon:yes gene_type:complete